DSPETKKFIDDFTKKFGKAPGEGHFYGYTAARAFGEALKVANGEVEDMSRFLGTLKGVKFDSPKGPFRFDEKQNAIVSVFIRKVEKQNGALQNTVIDRVDNVDQFWKAPA